MGQEKHVRPIKAWAQKWHTHLILLDITSQMAEPKINGGEGLILSLCQGQFKGHGYREVERTGTGNISPKKSRSAGSLVSVCGQGELEASHQDSRGNRYLKCYLYCVINLQSSFISVVPLEP